MNRITACLSLALPTVAFLLGSLAGGSPAQGAEQGAPQDLAAAVGVVDVDAVRRGYPVARELLETWKREEATVNGGLQEQVETLKKLKFEADSWDAFTPEWIQARADVRALEASLEEQAEMQKRRLLMRKLEMQESLYQDIERAISQLAAKRGLKLVLRSLREVPAEDALDNRVAAWASRFVFYSDQTLDLTEDVINFLKSADFSGSGPKKSENGK